VRVASTRVYASLTPLRPPTSGSFVPIAMDSVVLSNLAPLTYL
jgi:hypothetical protein